MRIWLELTQQEGESLFEIVKGFTIDRKKTVAMGATEDETIKAEEVMPENSDSIEKESAPAVVEMEEPAKTETIPIEKVRAVLSEKSRGDKQEEVKALITKFGANKLTDVDPAYYEQLISEAEVL